MSFSETGISKHFISITDPRMPGKTQHSLLNILTVTLCAVISGSDDFYDIAGYAENKQAFFETFLDLPNAMPSHDTVNRVTAKLKPDEFSQCIPEWTKSLSEQFRGVIAIDGKSLRRSFQDASKRTFFML